MKKTMRFTTSLILVMTLVLMFALGTLTTFASQQQQTGPKYQVIYPDGSIGGETYDTLEEAQAAADEEILLFSGKTDKDGKITLKDWHTIGEIRIVEKEVPAGYTAESTETVVDLSEGEVTIVNQKEEVEEEPADDNDDEIQNEEDEDTGVNPEDDAEENTEVKTGGVKTGDESDIPFWIVLLIGSAIGLAASLKRYYS